MNKYFTSALKEREIKIDNLWFKESRVRKTNSFSDFSPSQNSHLSQRKNIKIVDSEMYKIPMDL